MQSRKMIPEIWQVPQIFRDRLGDEAGRQRLMGSSGHLLLVLHAPPAHDEFNRQGRLFWREPNGTWHSTESGNGKEALRGHIDQFKLLIAELDQQEETASTAKDYFELTQRIAPLHRTIRNMAGVFQDARKAVSDDRELINLRDQTYELDRAAELLYANAKNALDFAIAKKSEEQARASHSMAISAHRLNLLAGFFFPIATLTAIFGTNLKTGLEEFNPPFPFLLVLAVGILMGTVLTTFVTRIRQTG